MAQSFREALVIRQKHVPLRDACRNIRDQRVQQIALRSLGLFATRSGNGLLFAQARLSGAAGLTLGRHSISAAPERPACPSRASSWSCHL
jgi:hypothetical protein